VGKIPFAYGRDLTHSSCFENISGGFRKIPGKLLQTLGNVTALFQFLLGGPWVGWAVCGLVGGGGEWGGAVGFLFGLGGVFVLVCGGGGGGGVGGWGVGWGGFLVFFGGGGGGRWGGFFWVGGGGGFCFGGGRCGGGGRGFFFFLAVVFFGGWGVGGFFGRGVGLWVCGGWLGGVGVGVCFVWGLGGGGGVVVSLPTPPPCSVTMPFISAVEVTIAN